MEVPRRFNKNAPDVAAMGTPTETGTMLIEYMCERLGVPDLAGLDVLDFGCGCRFAEAIVNNRLPVGSYTGIDLDLEMIGWLEENVHDPRLRFHHWDAANPLYNPSGFPLTPATALPTGPREFDVICMFSVITHQLPEDAEALFRILRRYVREHGQLFFSANLEEMPDGYRELEPVPTAHSAYSPSFLRQLLERSGWRVLSVEGKNHRDMPIQDSLLCAPASNFPGELPSR